MSCEMHKKDTFILNNIESAVNRIENRLNINESIKDRLQIFLESPDSLDLLNNHRQFLEALLKS